MKSISNTNAKQGNSSGNFVVSGTISFLMILLLAVLAVILGWGTQIKPPTHVPATYTPDLETNTIGVYLRPGNVLGPALQPMVDAGARWTRLTINWNSIEPELTEPPSYRWAHTDAVVRASVGAGIDAIMKLGVNAAWAADSFCGPIHAENRDDFQRYLRDIVTRYSAPPYNVRLWEIYNEPDSVFGSQGYCFGTRGELYADALKLAYTAIKEADSDALVLFGGISYDFFTSEGGQFDPEFLDDALAAGAGPYFDIFAFHYYPAFAERWDAFGPGVIGKATYLRQELGRYGLDKPMAITEVGRPTRAPAPEAHLYDEASTARFVAPALVQSRIAELAPVIWFIAADGSDTLPYEYGLLDFDFEPKQPYWAYRAVMPALQGADYGGELAVVGAGHAYRFVHPQQTAIVAWADVGEAELALTTHKVLQVDRWGNRQWLEDGGEMDMDQSIDGAMRLSITQDPVVFWLP